jgi:hypothetical protein
MTSTKHPSYKAEIVMIRDGSGREDYALSVQKEAGDPRLKERTFGFLRDQIEHGHPDFKEGGLVLVTVECSGPNEYIDFNTSRNVKVKRRLF